MKAPFRRNRNDEQSDALDPPPPAAGEQTAPSPSGSRGALRRRLRYLHRAHELGLRDLGGLVFDLHRFGRRNDQLVAAKLQALDTVDGEMRAIERALGRPRGVTELHEPGITACVRCGALHGSDARFCPSCGTQVSGPVAVGGPGVTPHPVAQPDPAPVVPGALTPAAPEAVMAQHTATPSPPIPASGPAPVAPPLWSVPQPPAEDAGQAQPPADDPS